MTDRQLLRDFCKWLSSQRHVHIENSGVYVYAEDLDTYVPAYDQYIADVEDEVW